GQPGRRPPLVDRLERRLPGGLSGVEAGVRRTDDHAGDPRGERRPVEAGLVKHSVLGVLVDATTYEEAADAVLTAARESRPFALTALAVHGVMVGVRDRTFGARLNSFDLVTPDGQPVRWALNSLHGAGLTDRVYGPDLTLHVLASAAAEGLPVY